MRSILFIAHNASVDSKVGIKEVALALDLPTHYLGKILQQLSKNGIIQSIKGPHGGFYLNEVSKNVKIIRIIEVVDGLDFFNQCGLGLSQCSDDHPCPIHNDFKVCRDGLLTLFSSKSIEDFLLSRQDIAEYVGLTSNQITKVFF